MVGPFRFSSWRWLPWNRRTFHVSQVVDAADEVPEHLPRNVAVVVGSLEHPTWIAFDCPCKQRHRILLNLDSRRRPVWSLHATDPLTLYPSIDYQGLGQRCHYVIRKGKVLWVSKRDEGE